MHQTKMSGVFYLTIIRKVVIVQQEFLDERSQMPTKQKPRKRRVAEPQASLLTRDEITEKVRKVLCEASGADLEDINEDTTLVGDLELESIDFLDVTFRLEKNFSTPRRPFRVEQGTFWPSSIHFFDDPEWTRYINKQDSTITRTGITRLKKHMPHIDFSNLRPGHKVGDLNDFVTVASTINYVEARLRT